MCCLCYTSVLADGTTPPPPDIQCSLNQGPTQATIGCTSSVDITGTECSIDGGDRQPCKDLVCSTCVCSPCKKIMSVDSQIHSYGPVPHRSAIMNLCIFHPGFGLTAFFGWTIINFLRVCGASFRKKNRKTFHLCVVTFPDWIVLGMRQFPWLVRKMAQKHKTGIKGVRSIDCQQA